MTLFDPPTPQEAAARRDDGMARAVAHSGPEWLAYAYDFVQVYLERNEFLFCDDVWAAGLIEPESPRAFGQVMKHALRSGWMEKTDRARPSVRSNQSGNGAPPVRSMKDMPLGGQYAAT